MTCTILWAGWTITVCAFAPQAMEAQKPASKAKDVIVLTGAPMGGVKFGHKLHVERAQNKCGVCHHASRPEKPATTAQQACTGCHTRPLAGGMKTTRQAAFHKSAAQTGICIDCHKQENAKGRKAPVRCAECHLKENKAVAGGRNAQPWVQTARISEVGVGGDGCRRVF